MAEAEVVDVQASRSALKERHVVCSLSLSLSLSTLSLVEGASV